MKGRHFITLDLCTIASSQLGEKLLVSLSKGETAILYQESPYLKAYS